jgi:hypothetical protein
MKAVKELACFYSYQAAQQLPLLAVIPLLSGFVGHRELASAAGYIVAVSLLSIVVDWGYSTLGSQRLLAANQSGNCIQTLVSSGERTRIAIWLFLVLLIIVVAVACKVLGIVATGSIPNDVVVIIVGTFSFVAYPNWIIVGLKFYGRVVVWTAIFRITAATLLAFFMMSGYPAVSAITFFYLYSLIGAVIFRFAASQMMLPLRRKNTRNGSEESALLFRHGFALTLGHAVSYATLNTGVPLLNVIGYQEAAAIFVIADRGLALCRAAIAPLVQYLLVDSGRKVFQSTLAQLFAAAFVFLALGLITGCIIMGLSDADLQSWKVFLILSCGFALLPFQHRILTLAVLAQGHVRLWLSILIAGFISYLFVFLTLTFLGLAPPWIGVSIAILAAELVLLIISVKFRRKITFDQK